MAVQVIDRDYSYVRTHNEVEGFRSAAGKGADATVCHDSEYTGTYKDGLKHGRGEETMWNGNHFKGRYESGWQRQGTYTFQRGDAYTGEFERGMFHGFGVFTWGKDGCTTYVGTFRENLRHGVGTVYQKRSKARHALIPESLDGNMLKVPLSDEPNHMLEIDLSAQDSEAVNRILKGKKASLQIWLKLAVRIAQPCPVLAGLQRLACR